MSNGLNRVILIGNLGQDPELRYTSNGQGVLNIRMATTETYFDKNKEKQERTEWHTVTVWGKRGEALNKILSKGSSICVEGRIQNKAWEDKSGNKRYGVEIVATNVVLLGSGKGADRNTSTSRQVTSQYTKEDFPDDDRPFSDSEDDIPF